MPDDKMQNDDFNQSNNPEEFDSLHNENPLENNDIEAAAEDNAEDSFDAVQDIVQHNEIPHKEEPLAKGYNFNEIEGQAVNAQEVKIDHSEDSNDPVTVRPVEFTQFDSYTPTNTDTNKNLELLMDIKLELTVELGRCQLPVKKVLELTRGSIIELDKVAGESVELYANGKHVANGEVVVIEDNFGLRITSITDPEERIKSLN